MILLSLLAYILFFVLVFFILKGSREQQLIALIFVNIFFYINVTLIVKPELTPFQLLPYLFFAKELLFNFHEFKKNIQEFPIKFGVLIIFAAYFVTTYTNGGGGHDYYEVFRYCFDKYLPMFAVFICAKEVEEQRIVRILFTFFLIYFGFGLVEYLLNHNYIREAIATAFPSTKAKDMFGPAGITNGFGTSSFGSPAFHHVSLFSLLFQGCQREIQHPSRKSRSCRFTDYHPAFRFQNLYGLCIPRMRNLFYQLPFFPQKITRHHYIRGLGCFFVFLCNQLFFIQRRWQFS